MSGPRRARARWLEGAPDYIIDCIYTKSYCEWVVLLKWPNHDPDYYQRRGLIPILCVNDCPESPNMGVSMFDECHKDWRAKTKDRVRWLDIPEHVRKHIIRRCG